MADQSHLALIKQQFAESFGLGDDDTVLSFFQTLVGNGNPLESINAEMTDMLGDIYNPEVGRWAYDLLLHGPSVAQPEVTSAPTMDYHEQPMAHVEEHSAPQAQPAPAQPSSTMQAPTISSEIRIRGVSRTPGSAGKARQTAKPYQTDKALRSSKNGGVGKGNDRKSVFDRLGTAVNVTQLLRDETGNSGPPGRFSKSNNILRDAEGHKIRCPEWPRCMNQATCFYHHPSRLCGLLPNCPYTAQTCDYIHPEMEPPQHAPTTTLCRFGVACTNRYCTFAHPNSTKAPICAYHPNCLRPDCKYEHPGRGSLSIGAKKVPVLCREGTKCQRPNCFFTHPGDTPIEPPGDAENGGNDMQVESKPHISDRPFASSVSESFDSTSMADAVSVEPSSTTPM
ncbi:hypothetical protein H4R33_006027 [Dimargaris cristalligena]|uniref:C3H1-type domain-containing protein n=1 Tax=Dimargaris cristalligena TaxID=215637 RepID=A0A4P9ZT45_9FUNG|nr:hypothetical protein H4R33_006027 [Dimargaris cristalligena]RKP36615.1 hypothetical protein BJ085DRAFT_39817 [Dimargaris cristalligena]|eukprot:RKP36615.1 hypothetical protein BJ085DRAFT_39817 [Dimargaris cristalligena]